MNHFDGAATRSRNNLLSVQKGTKTMQTRLKFLLGAVAAVTVSGCTAVQDTFQVGEREFSFDTVVEVQESGEAFRFQGFQIGRASCREREEIAEVAGTLVGNAEARGMRRTVRETPTRRESNEREQSLVETP